MKSLTHKLFGDFDAPTCVRWFAVSSVDLAVILSLVLILAAVKPARAQQTSPTTPPPPPTDAPSAKPISPSTPPPPPPPETSPAPRNNAPTDKQGKQQDKPIDPSTPPPPPDEDSPAAPATESAEPSFDPYHAQKSLDVGTFYLKKGNYDAAIDRFQEAAHYQPSLAMPWRLLGETYEKQHAYAAAMESYKKYLDVFPRAPDAAKITKEISLLEEKVGKEPSKDAAH
jgi:tetratricopeptide (TPR) repeat protein